MVTLVIRNSNTPPPEPPAFTKSEVTEALKFTASGGFEDHCYEDSMWLRDRVVLFGLPGREKGPLISQQSDNNLTKAHEVCVKEFLKMTLGY